MRNYGKRVIGYWRLSYLLTEADKYAGSHNEGVAHTVLKNACSPISFLIKFMVKRLCKERYGCKGVETDCRNYNSISNHTQWNNATSID